MVALLVQTEQARGLWGVQSTLSWLSLPNRLDISSSEAQLLNSCLVSLQAQMPARFNEFGTELPYSELHFFSKNFAMRAEFCHAH